MKKEPQKPMPLIMRAGLQYLIILLLFCGCSQLKPLPEENTLYAYSTRNIDNTPTYRYSPTLIVYDHKNEHNRIGEPSIRKTKNNHETLYINTERPVIYHEIKQFQTEKQLYTNHIYRVHFPKIPFSLIPFHLSAGKNTGLMIIITVDPKENPLLVTTVHTCGCYLSITPTTSLESHAYPKDWKGDPLEIYGESLPAELDYTKLKKPVLIVSLRPDVHRVMSLALLEKDQITHENGFTEVPSRLLPMNNLKTIPGISGSIGTTSFYHETGIMKGYVKKSVKIWETLFLGLISLDFYVGTDKIYGDTDESGRVFYTSLKPWNRKRSDMRDFLKFLKFWGWNL